MIVTRIFIENEHRENLTVFYISVYPSLIPNIIFFKINISYLNLKIISLSLRSATNFILLNHLWFNFTDFVKQRI